MLKLYTWTTPNGYKVPMMLEECAIPYEIVPINISAGQQHSPEYITINPNSKIPALVDTEAGLTIFESGAILMYLAEKTGRFLPTEGKGRYEVIQWLMFQMGNVGPLLGQAHHFRQNAPEKILYAIDRYTNEAARLYGVMESRLAAAPYLGGAEYSIADIATWPWVRRHERHGQKLEDFPQVKRWYDAIEARPATIRALEAVDAAAAPLKNAA